MRVVRESVLGEVVLELSLRSKKLRHTGKGNFTSNGERVWIL